MAKSGNIQCHYDSSKNVYDISSVSVMYRYESMTIHDGKSPWLILIDRSVAATLMRVNHGGTTNAHGACTVRYGTSTIHGGSRRGQLWSSVAKPWMIRRTTVDNSW